MLRPVSSRAGRGGHRGERSPPSKRSPYITLDGAKKLRAELDELWTRERPRVTQEVADAAAQGDRSENAEYIYGKRRLREIDRRVRFLSKRLDEVKVVVEPPSDPARVFFSAYVTVEDDDGKDHTYRIVGADESDMAKGFISIDSPVARALIGKRVDDEVTIKVPKGEVVYTIKAVEYR
ncbi:MAG: transcription elongation factor GreB [Deltaproteobacteria bacterium]|nr:transcription elongation factor GreB [Deltaproteobacteria bacterium]